MFNRKELKRRAKEVIKKNYGIILLISVILAIATSATSCSSTSFSKAYESFGKAYIFEYVDNAGIYYNDNGELPVEDLSQYAKAHKTTGTFLGIIALLIAVLRILVLAPLEVGCRRWLILNTEIKPQFSEIGYAFKKGYWNVVKTMFLRDLYTFLWACLCFIPGIMKRFEYYMIPYILADDSTLDTRTVFDKSASLMDGNKFATMVMNLSFIPWTLLGLCTCGILNLLWVDPYMNCTTTELYIELCYPGGRSTYDMYIDDTPSYSYGNNAGDNDFRKQLFGDSVK